MEPGDVILVRQIDPQRTQFTLKVHILKLWSNPSKYNKNEKFSIDMICIDEEGTVIQATIFKEHIFKFQDRLQEGSSYLFINPTIGEMKNPLFTLRGQMQKLSFLRTTNIRKSVDFTGSKTGFSFVEYHTILSTYEQSSASVDVIGLLVRRSGIIVNPTGDKNWMELYIENLEGEQLKVTLWAELAFKMLDYVEKHQTDEPVIVLVQFGKKNVYKGEISVQSWYTSTKLFINSDIDEINQMKKTYLARFGESQSSSAITMIPSRITSINDDFLVNHELKHINQILDPVQITKVIIVGTIVSIRADLEWTYPGCQVCRYSVKSKWIAGEVKDDSVPDDIEVYECTGPLCKQISTTFVPRYKIPIVVQDELGKVVLTLFDRESEAMLKMTCKDLVAKTLENGFDVKQYPADVNVLKNKYMAFKVSIGKFNVETKNQQYSVARVTEDPQIIETLTSQLYANSDKLLFHPMNKSESATQDSMTDVSQTAENATPISVEIPPNKDAEALLPSAADLKRKFDDVVDVDDYAAASSTKKPNDTVLDDSQKILLIPKIEK